MVTDLTFLLYLIAAILFIFGLKKLQTLSRARVGNLYAAAGMGLAVLATLIVISQKPDAGWAWILIGLLLGGAAGLFASRRVQMAEMPQMVAVFNGFGGAASALVACSLFFGLATARFDEIDQRRPRIENDLRDTQARIATIESRIATARAEGDAVPPATEQALADNREQLAAYQAALRPTLGTVLGSGLRALTLALAVLLGFATFAGSLLAFGKLQETEIKGHKLSDSIRVRHYRSIGLGVLTLALLLAFLFAFALSGSVPTAIGLILLGLLGLGLGVLLVLPIGGADMPVVISMLNAYSGLAAAMTGFAVGATTALGMMLIVGGALVGAAGLILTRMMSRAMNRSLFHIISGGWSSSGDEARRYGDYQHVREAQPIDVALACANAREVVIVPGFGMAAAQAQHAVKDVFDALSAQGVHVRFAVHSVAGRMPGHMNVLLAEADIPYDRMFTREEINRDFATTDVVLVLGANDVVNPAAHDDPDSPLYGMPVLDVHEARTVYVVKRSLSPGYAGVRNPLFEHESTQMVFGDAKLVMNELLEELARQAAVA